MNSPGQIQRAVVKKFPRFGVNKRREIVRLVYEIAKREKNDCKEILSCLDTQLPFDAIKAQLIGRRLPSLIPSEREGGLALPALAILKREGVVLQPKFSFHPERIFVEKEAVDTSLALKVKARFPRVPHTVISSYKEFIADKNFSIREFNRRAKTLFLVNERFHFLSPCPCTAQGVGCGYQIANLGFGCPYECSYCFLQGYTNSLGIVLPANIQDFLNRLEQIQHPARMGTGQFTDSLVLEALTGYAAEIIEFLRVHPHITFEFKTKSANVKNLLKISPPKNVVLAWSVNPQRMIEENEFYTASLSQRLKAAQQCAQAGYRIAFHFDPIIRYQGWEKDYAGVVEQIFAYVPAAQISWVSLGTLRLIPRLKTVMETRFVNNSILDEEFILGYDGKLRYATRPRIEIYSKLLQALRKQSKDVYVYLCMEERRVSEEVGLKAGNF